MTTSDDPNSGFGDDGDSGVLDLDQLDPADTLDSGNLLADPLDTGYSPPEYEPPSLRYDTTADEVREGESLDRRLQEEVPDVLADPDPLGDAAYDDDYVPDARAGRLIAPDEGAHEDDESDSIAVDAGIDGAGATAEEAAMHVIGDDDSDSLDT